MAVGNYCPLLQFSEHLDYCRKNHENNTQHNTPIGPCIGRRREFLGLYIVTTLKGRTYLDSLQDADQTKWQSTQYAGCDCLAKMGVRLNEFFLLRLWSRLLILRLWLIILCRICLLRITLWLLRSLRLIRLLWIALRLLGSLRLIRLLGIALRLLGSLWLIRLLWCLWLLRITLRLLRSLWLIWLLWIALGLLRSLRLIRLLCLRLLRSLGLIRLLWCLWLLRSLRLIWLLI